MFIRVKKMFIRRKKMFIMVMTEIHLNIRLDLNIGLNLNRGWKDLYQQEIHTYLNPAEKFLFLLSWAPLEIQNILSNFLPTWVLMAWSD